MAIMLALIVPTSQLPTIDTQTECCCPDPDKCKCHDHDGDDTTPTMRTCHKTSKDFVAPVLSVFVAPAIARTHAPRPSTLVAEHVLASPHPPPPPRRPDAPS